MDFYRFAPVMTAAEEVNKMDIVLIGDNILFLHIMKTNFCDDVYHSH